jgi:hypothetical protein
VVKPGVARTSWATVSLTDHRNALALFSCQKFQITVRRKGRFVIDDDDFKVSPPASGRREL